MVGQWITWTRLTLINVVVLRVDGMMVSPPWKGNVTALKRVLRVVKDCPMVLCDSHSTGNEAWLPVKWCVVLRVTEMPEKNIAVGHMNMEWKCKR